MHVPTEKNPGVDGIVAVKYAKVLVQGTDGGGVPIQHTLLVLLRDELPQEAFECV